MTKFRVHFESSAAVGLEFEVEADSQEAAAAKGQSLLENGKLTLALIVDELIKPSQEATDGYAAGSIHSLKYATVELDENGFEVVDVFTPETVEEAA